MIKLILAYILAFFLAITLGGLVGIMEFPLAFLCSKNAKNGVSTPCYLLTWGTTTFVIGFVYVWIATVVFSWFGFQLTLLMVIILGFGAVNNDFYQISHAPEARLPHEVAGAVGELFGIVIGGIYFL